MDTHRFDSPDAASLDPASPRLPAVPAAANDAPAPPARLGWFEGHAPDLVDPLVPPHPETAFAETRALRHDGWAPERMSGFLDRLAECGIVAEACRGVGMSARAAYNLRDRDPLFAAGWEAASAMARPKLADEAYSRAVNGVLERIYKDGAIVAERHRYDNRLTMSVLARLDARADRAEERGAPHLALVARWDDYLAALAEGRREDGLALLAPVPDAALPRTQAGPAPGAAAEPASSAVAGDRELRELRPTDEPEEEEDHHGVWESEDGWWTDYPPPPGFDGEEEGEYGDHDYKRALSPEEQAVIDSDQAEEAEEEAEALACQRSVAQAQRDAFFGFGFGPDREPGPGGDPAPAEPAADPAPP